MAPNCRMCVCVRACVYTYVCIHVCVPVIVSLCLACVHVCASLCLCAYMHAHTCRQVVGAALHQPHPKVSQVQLRHLPCPRPPAQTARPLSVRQESSLGHRLARGCPVPSAPQASDAQGFLVFSGPLREPCLLHHFGIKSPKCTFHTVCLWIFSGVLAIFLKTFYFGKSPIDIIFIIEAMMSSKCPPPPTSTVTK